MFLGEKSTTSQTNWKKNTCKNGSHDSHDSHGLHRGSHGSLARRFSRPEKLWLRSWKCCPRLQAEGSIFEPEVTVFHYMEILPKDVLKNRFFCNYFMLVAFISPVKFSKIVFACEISCEVWSFTTKTISVRKKNHLKSDFSAVNWIVESEEIR